MVNGKHLKFKWSKLYTGIWQKFFLNVHAKTYLTVLLYHV